MRRILLLISIAVFTLIGCTDVLELAPQDQLSEIDVWNDETLIRFYTNALYSKVFQQGLYRDTQTGGATDEIHSIKNAGNYYYIQTAALNADNINSINAYLNSWSNSYAYIRDINIFFEKIESSPIDDALKQQFKAEMKFLDAFIYANLISRYGGVPIINKTFKLGEDYSVTRDSYDDCVAHIISELDEAISVLPDKRTSAELGLVSADAARALKSRVLLYAASPLNNPTNNLNKWQQAADAAEALINVGRYSLYSNYQSLFLSNNDEIIFARYFTQANTHQLNLQVGRNGDHGYGSDTPSQNLVNSYEMTNGELPYDELGNINPASGYDPQNPYINRDPRFYASILYDSSIWMGRATETFAGGKDSRTGPIDAWNGTMSGYYLKKFVPEDIPPMGNSVKPTDPWIMFRYAEVLLNYAEAKFELGDESTAREYINKVRARDGVNMPPITATGEELRKKIQHERQIELVFEGHRYFDIRRWKIANKTEIENLLGIIITKLPDGSKTYNSTNLLLHRQWDERLYLLPIPRTEIDRSNGTLEQNPGYD